MRRFLTLFGLLILAADARSQAPAPPSDLPVPGPPASVVPSIGLKAEGEKRWEDALRIYRSVLVREPARADLWKRVADIEGALGRKGEAADALVRAAEAAPDKPGPWLDAARALSAAGQTDRALEMCDRALAPDPQNLDALHLRASYANWAKKPEIAAETCERILKLAPEDDAVRLMLARSRAWSGDPDRAVEAYRQAFGKKITAQWGRPGGWPIFLGLIEKIFFPVGILLMMFYQAWEPLIVTISAETALLMVILAIISPGRRVSDALKGLLTLPLRYAVAMYDLVTVTRFTLDLWVYQNRAWRK